MMDNFKNELDKKNIEELLKEAMSLWDKEGYFDSDDKNSQFYNIENDPVVKLLMTALAYQSNNIKEEIYRFKNNLLEELTEQIIPYNLIKPIPSFSIIETKKEKSIDYDCFANEETPFILEKEIDKGNSKRKEKEVFQFIPLIKTKIIDARIDSVQKIEQNKFSVIMVCDEPITDLNGISFYFLTNLFSDISISINNFILPLIKPNNYEKLPFTGWFNNESILFENSLFYGTIEYWRELFVVQDFKLFIVDKYDTTKIILNRNSNKIEMKFEFVSNEADFNLDINEIKINCVPIVNVEKQSITLSHDEPIKKIANENQFDLSLKESNERISSSDHKQFLNLLAPTQSIYDRSLFSIRRFGMERFNKNELLIQINTLLNKYSSDFYAFRGVNGLKDGAKLRNLNIALKDVIDEIIKDEKPNQGIYLVLNQSDSLYEQNKSIEISYLLTNSVRANDININSTIRPSIEFDKKETRLLRETSGGKDWEMNQEIKKNIAQYCFLTKDRLVTKSDIRFFCIKELLLKYSIKEELIENIDILNEIETTTQGSHRYILIDIILKSTFTNKFDLSRMENQIKNMIEIRSTNIYPIKVKISILLN
ncbi:MAG: hypothetical protein ACOYO1_00720 [Bacteroidales bacterium]